MCKSYVSPYSIGVLAKCMVAILCGACFWSLAPALAEWSTDPYENNPVCTADSLQFDAVVIPDGMGGTISAWYDSRDGQEHIYCQRLDSEGIPAWNTDGVRACTYTSRQVNPILVSDGSGGAIVVWEDGESDDTQLYSQSITASGLLLWSSDGIRVSNALGVFSNAVMVSDLAGGAIIAWENEIDDHININGQRLFANGDRAWEYSGIVICDAPDDQEYISMIPYGGGAIVAWTDNRGEDKEIYAQYIDNDGTSLWDANGRQISEAPDTSYGSRLARHPGGGFVMLWTETFDPYPANVVCQKFDILAQPMWYPSEIVVAFSDNDMFGGALTVDEEGNSFVTWREGEIFSFSTHAQRLDGYGLRKWTDSGVLLQGPTLTYDQITIDSDGAGGCFVSWLNWTTIFGTNTVHAQRVNALGQTCWPDGGIVVMATPGLGVGGLTVDEEGGLVYVRSDARQSVSELWHDIYAQRIDPTGYHGRPRPTLNSVVDFPNDQGGTVVVNWGRVYMDDWPWAAVESYSVWTREPEAALPRLMNEEAATALADRLHLSCEQVLELTRSGWTYVNDIPAAQEADYSCQAFTFGDSTAAGIPLAEYRVLAHGNAPWLIWESEVVSGYSVDNIAPGAPIALLGEPDGDASVNLEWTASGDQDEDLSVYTIYRGETAGFPVDEAHLLGTTADLTYSDPCGFGTWFYRVTAVDVHGNEGTGSNEVEVMVTSSAVDNDGQLPGRNFFYAATPNPVTRNTTLAFDLAQPAEVALSIWSVDGRLLATLASGVYNAGHHQVRWSGTNEQGRDLSQGVYFARFRAGSHTSRQRLLLIR
jgi:FlgD Ig-like domain